MADEEFSEVADECGMRPPQSRMRVFFASRRPVALPCLEIDAENPDEFPEKPPERRFVRPDHAVGDFLQGAVRFPPRELEQVAVSRGDLVGLASLDRHVPRFPDGGFDAVASVDRGEKRRGIPGGLHRGKEFPVVRDGFLGYRDGSERFAGNPVGRGEESPLPGSFLPEERGVED